MIPRHAAGRLRTLARGFPVVAVTGPRQSGKTTLVRSVFPEKPYVSLEDPDVREQAQRDPRGFLACFAGGCVLDEAQRFPELFSYLQGEVDAHPRAGRYVVTGSSKEIVESIRARTRKRLSSRRKPVLEPEPIVAAK